MPIAEALKNFFSNPWVWGILLAVALISYGTIKKFFRKVPLLNNRTTTIWVAVIGIVLTTGLVGSLGVSSLSSKPAAVGFAVTDLQFTTGPNGFCTTATDSNVDDLVNVRCNGTQLSESSGNWELNNTIITVTRTGSLEPMSCTVRASTQRNYGSERTPGDGLTYTVLETTTLGELEAYLSDGSAASSSSPKETTSLTFADGVATRTLGVNLEVANKSMSVLNQYSYKDVILDTCGKFATFRIQYMTA
ncbi:hypothetical protein HYX18_01295 [Candidatus Woesearchaeota archaeon]|nr:hypothetical protein [Candidatus Woesearchaeota archaeon]